MRDIAMLKQIRGELNKKTSRYERYLEKIITKISQFEQFECSNSDDSSFTGIETMIKYLSYEINNKLVGLVDKIKENTNYAIDNNNYDMVLEVITNKKHSTDKYIMGILNYFDKFGDGYYDVEYVRNGCLSILKTLKCSLQDLIENNKKIGLFLGIQKNDDEMEREF